MPPNSIFLLAACGCFAAALSASLSAVETALFSLDSNGKKTLKMRFPAAAKRIEDLTTDSRKTANCLLLGNSLLHFALIFIGLLILQTAGFPRLPGWLLASGVFFAVLLLCEVFPKIIAVQYPVEVLGRLSRVGGTLVDTLAPLATFLQNLGDQLFGRYFLAEPLSPESRKEEYIGLLDLAKEEQILFEEATVLRNVVKLGEKEASQCMTPRVDCFFLPDSLTQEEAISTVRTRRFRKILVHGESRDHILGILDVRQFLLSPSIFYLEQLHAPSFIPESMNAVQLLQNFLSGKQRFALLLDDYGGFEGIVTLSDLLEEIFGDSGGAVAGNALYIEKINADRYLVCGSARLEDITEQTGIDFSETEADTIAGLLGEIHGSIPVPGTLFAFGAWRAVVRRASRKRIREVALEHNPKEVEA